MLPDISLLPTPSSQLSTIYCEEDEVYEILASLNPSKSPGNDNIAPVVLKSCALVLYEHVTHIFNLSLFQAKFPCDWKHHKITPIPKKGDLHLVSNYRPISLLPVISKVLETIVYNKTIDFIRPKLNKQQFGFLKSRSCLSQMLVFLNKVIHYADEHYASDVVYLDFRKAFDSVPHDELLFKLWSLGITGSLWFWFRSYLRNRLHFTTFNNHSSSSLPVASGVPQGSVLGPLLFLIYINDLPLCSPSDFLLFADDTKILKCIESHSSQASLQLCLDHVSSWCDQWNLRLNGAKCAILKIALHPSHDAISDPSFQYSIAGNPVVSVQKQRDLGLTLTSNLSWSNHYDSISSKAYHALFLIRRTLSPNISISTKKTLYLSLVRSHLSFCSQVWHPYLTKHIIQLERIQKKATKYILQGSPYSDYRQRLISLDLLPLMYWFDLQDIMFLIKSFKTPSDNFDPLSYVSFVSNNTRSSSSGKLVHKFSKTSFSRHFYFNRVVRLWNSLPRIDLSLSVISIKNIIIEEFWSHFYTHFISDLPCTYHFLCPCNRCVGLGFSSNY